MENEKVKFLPFGTIVKLKTGNKKVKITGFCMYDNEHSHNFRFFFFEDLYFIHFDNCVLCFMIGNDE